VNKIYIDGIGLHSGKTVGVTLIPNSNHGIRFFKNSIPVTKNVNSTELSTSIGTDNKISTIEHFMSLLYALEMFNVDIDVVGNEMPILDGSSIEIYNKMLEQDFIVDCSNNPPPIVITQDLKVTKGNSYIKISPCERTEIDFIIDFDHPLIGEQKYNFVLTPETYINEIAPARTFGFYREYEYLKSIGYVKGGSLSNVVVLTDDGIMNVNGLRFPDEFVRHKILDLIGDFSLLERPFIGKIEAYKSGHTLNNEMVELIKMTLCN